MPWAVTETASILPIKYKLVPEIHASINRNFFSLTFIELNFKPFLPLEAHRSIQYWHLCFDKAQELLQLLLYLVRCCPWL